MSSRSKLLWPLSLVVHSSILGLVGSAAAHGFGQRYDLPVPLWLYTLGAAATVVVSFLVVGVFVRATPGQHTSPRLNLLRSPAGRFLAHPWLLVGVQLVSVVVFIAGILAGLFGQQNPTKNLAPTLVWVIWWVGLAYVSALIGNLWALVNPWKILFGWAEQLYRHVTCGAELSRAWPYPRTLGVWPGVLLFLVFAWVELVFEDAAAPSVLAGLALLYSAITWTGMFLFGKEVWLRYGEAFSLVFGLLARFAPTEVRVTDTRVCQDCRVCGEHNGVCIDCYACFARAKPNQREWNLRPFAVGLFQSETLSLSETVFVLLLLATVTFDGFLATPLWVGMEAALQEVVSGLGNGGLRVIRTFGLLVFPLLFLEIYFLVSVCMALASKKRLAAVRLARVFALSLVPIAIAYHMAHYFSFLLIQGQSIIPLVSDPFGWGWNLFGSAGYRVNIGVVGARFGWYMAVITIVVGHIIAVYVAHRVAMCTLRDQTLALRSQYPMLALMVGYTVVSLWILAQPIMEGGAGASHTIMPPARKDAMAAFRADASHVLPEPPISQVQMPQVAQTLLEAVLPLSQDGDTTADAPVRSSILCFCLHKGPEAIRELRRTSSIRAMPERTRTAGCRTAG